MKYRDNVILQFTLITLAVVLTVSATLGYLLSKQMTKQTIAIHINSYPRIIEEMAKANPSVYGFFKTGAVSSDVEKTFRRLESFGAVFRVKVWDAWGTIIWSEKKEIIGKNYYDNKEYQDALDGAVSYAVAAPGKSEHVTEAGVGSILEIYTPVIKDGRIIGVIELYENAGELFWNIEKNNAIVWQMVSAAGLSIYALLFFIFYRSHQKLRAFNRRLLQVQDVTIYALAYQAELRDMETGRHIERTSLYVEILARGLREFSPYRKYLTNDYIADLAKSAPLHDIGKVGVSDLILRKPGTLTPEEFTEMKKHCDMGAHTLRKAEERLTFQSFLKIAIQIAQSHHEKWSGEGYPHGLAGDAIPLSARIMALADVYDALRSERYYKKAFDHIKSREIITGSSGTHFDPMVVEAFMRGEKEFIDISVKLAD